MHSQAASTIRDGCLHCGDVLVAESAAPGTDPGPPGLKGFFFKMFQKKAGAAVPSANRITLLRDADDVGNRVWRVSADRAQ